MTKKTKPYWQKLQDPRWQRKRLEILERAGFRCEQCDDESKMLHVHHCYYTGGDPWIQGSQDGDMLKALCESCHADRQQVEQEIRLTFSRLLAQLDKHQLDCLLSEMLSSFPFECVNGLLVIPADKYEMDADVRWFFEAEKNPEFRAIYERVIGRSFPWDKFEAVEDYAI